MRTEPYHNLKLETKERDENKEGFDRDEADGVRGERRPVPLALRSAAFGEQIETSGPHPEGEISVEPFIRRAARANVARGRLPGRAQGFPPEGIPVPLSAAAEL